MAQLTVTNSAVLVRGSVTLRPLVTRWLSATGLVRTYGAAEFAKPGIPLPLSATGLVVARGRAAVSTQAPYGTFRDFAHYQTNTIDPARALIKSVYSGVDYDEGQQPIGQRRIHTTIMPPVDYPVSSGLAWVGASYMGAGVKFAQMPKNEQHRIDSTQIEVSNFTATGPTEYQNARGLNVHVKPSRLNWFPNPWFADANSDGVADQGIAYEYLPAGQPSPTGSRLSSSQQQYITSTSIGPGVRYGARFTVPVAPDAGIWTVSVDYAFNGAPAGTTAGMIVTPRLAGSSLPEYQQPAVVGPDQSGRLTVTLPDATFDAFYVYLYLFNGGAATVTDQISLSFSKPLVEMSPEPGEYFDGSFGVDYLWEQGKAEGSGTSFWYPKRIERSYLIQQLLAENCPLGVLPGTPDFGVLPTQ